MLNLRWGVCPFRMDFAENPTDRIYHAFQVGRETRQCNGRRAGCLWVLRRLALGQGRQQGLIAQSMMSDPAWAVTAGFCTFCSCSRRAG